MWNAQHVVSLIPALNQSTAWVSEVLDFRTQYVNPPDLYMAKQIIGPATATVYGDYPYAYCPRGSVDTLDPQFTYTEFIHVKFEQKLFAHSNAGGIGGETQQLCPSVKYNVHPHRLETLRCHQGC